MKIISKKWGYEIILVSTELYSCKLMVIKGGYQCSVHRHKLKDESFILLAGKVKLYLDKAGFSYDREMEFLEPTRIFPNTKHKFSGFSLYSVLLEVATQDIASDSYRDTESGKIEDKQWSADDMLKRG